MSRRSRWPTDPAAALLEARFILICLTIGGLDPVWRDLCDRVPTSVVGDSVGMGLALLLKERFFYNNF